MLTAMSEAVDQPPAVVFPAPFHCYKPATHKVFGAVCMTTDNRVLVVKGRRSGKWSFPKGHKLPRETYLQCALRETMEETGVDLSEVRPSSSHRFSAGEYYFFEVEEPVDVAVRDTVEVEEAKWLTLEQIAELQCNVDVNYFLDRIDRRLRRAARRRASAALAAAESTNRPQTPLAPEN